MFYILHDIKVTCNKYYLFMILPNVSILTLHISSKIFFIMVSKFEQVKEVGSTNNNDLHLENKVLHIL